MIRYLNKFNGMVYWVQDDRVVCAEKYDLDDYIPSCFSVVEFYEVLEFDTAFEELK